MRGVPLDCQPWRACHQMCGRSFPWCKGIQSAQASPHPALPAFLLLLCCSAQVQTPIHMPSRWRTCGLRKVRASALPARHSCSSVLSVNSTLLNSTFPAINQQPITLSGIPGAPGVHQAPEAGLKLEAILTTHHRHFVSSPCLRCNTLAAPRRWRHYWPQQRGSTRGTPGSLLPLLPFPPPFADLGGAKKEASAVALAEGVPTHNPKRLRGPQQPIVVPAVEVDQPGCSFNPDFEEHQVRRPHLVVFKVGCTTALAIGFSMYCSAGTCGIPQVALSSIVAVE